MAIENQYWLDRWRENRIGFHSREVNPLLERFLPHVAPTQSGRALVPLCGKSLDLKWLAKRGYDVIGVDLSEIAARSFFVERGMEYETSAEPPFTVFRGERITFLVGDFFELEADKTKRFDFIYDRAALIALPAPVRPRYAQKLQSLLAPDGSILLIGLEYDTQHMDGPPFSVPESEIRTLFDGNTVEKLYDHDCIESEPRFKERGLTWMRETVFKIAARKA